MELGQFTVRNHSGVRVRGGRGFRDEFSAFHASAYPQLAAQTLAITGDAAITRAATDTTLARVWRSWPSLRRSADVLVRARWTAVLVAAERESTTRSEHADTAIEAAVEEITGAAAVAADTVVVAALQRLPRVQRRALVLHYMGDVSVRHLSELSGSSAEHIELLLDDGFTALASSLEWSGADDPGGPDLSFDWVAEALTDTAARLPEQIPAPLPKVLLRNATAVRWSVRAIPVAACAACAAVMAAIAQPEPPPELHVAATYAAPAGSPAVGAVDGVLAPAGPSGTGPTADDGPDPDVRVRSIALTSLLDTHGDTSDADPRPDARDAEVRRAPPAPQVVQAQRADAGRLVGGAKRAPGAGATKEAPAGRAQPSPAADTGAPAAFPALRAPTPLAVTVPVQDEVLALPTAPSTGRAEVALPPVGIAPAITAPQSLSRQPAEPQATRPRVKMMGTGDERAGSSSARKHGGKHGESNTHNRRSIR